MHTIILIASGLAVLAFLVIGGRAIGGDKLAVRCATWFLPLWLVAALVNLWVGVSMAGYPLSVELPVLIAIFGVPAIAALLARARLARH